MKRVFAFIGFTVAITLILLNIISFNYIYLIISIAVVLFATSLLLKTTRQAKVLPTVLGSVIFACLIFMLVNVSSVAPAKSLDNSKADVRFQITDIPEYNINSDSYIYVIKTSQINKSGAPQNIKVRLKAGEKISADYYDVIEADLSFYSTTDNAFDSYGQYGDGIYICAKLDEIKSVSESSSKPINYHLLKLREHIFDLMNTNFKGDTAGLSIALLTGDKTYLSYDTESQFRLCGLSHFLAVSGFHISLICMGLYSFLKFIRVPKVVNTVVSLFVMFVYCGVADFSMSSVRAAVMLCVLLISQLFKAKADALNSLGIAVFILCLNPFAVTDVSAVLTVSAMLGIFVIYQPIIKALRNKNKLLYKSDSVTLLSICILLAVMPSMYVFFESISIGSVFLNVLIEPLVVLLIAFVVLFCVLSAVPGLSFVISAVIKFISYILLELIDFTSNNFVKMYGELSGEIFGLSIAAVFIFVGVCILVKKRVPIKGIAAFIVAVSLIAGISSCYQNSVNAHIYIDESSMTAIYDNRNAVIIGMNSRYDEIDAQGIIKNRNVFYIDCDRYVDSADSDVNFSETVGENITIHSHGKTIDVKVYDKVFKITADYVIIGENKFKRNTYSQVSDSYSTDIVFSENSQLVVRRDSSG